MTGLKYPVEKKAVEDSKYPIEKGLAPRSGGGWKYPFRSMDIGDSFYCGDRTKPQVWNAAFAYSKKHPDFFFVVEHEQDGVRCYRVAEWVPTKYDKQPKPLTLETLIALDETTER